MGTVGSNPTVSAIASAERARSEDPASPPGEARVPRILCPAPSTAWVGRPVVGSSPRLAVRVSRVGLASPS
jgi:hypothetical protein